jgi:hypothetical protein
MFFFFVFNGPKPKERKLHGGKRSLVLIKLGVFFSSALLFLLVAELGRFSLGGRVCIKN